MRYVDALKIWNQTENNGKWCFVEKGSLGHSQVLEIMKNGEAPKAGPKKRIIKVKRKQPKAPKKQVGNGSVWDLPEFRNELKKHSRADLRQMGYGMDGNGMIMPGNGLILPGRQQRGAGDLPWDVILDVAQNPMSYVNKAGNFLDSTSGTKQMAEQIERETGAKRLFKWPWEN